MNINLTFIIQMVHFFIAYKILEYIFLRYGVRELEEETAFFDGLIKNAQAQEYEISQIEKHMKQEWILAQSHLKEHSPQTTAYVYERFFFQVPPLEPVIIKNQKLVIQETANILTQKVVDVPT